MSTVSKIKAQLQGTPYLVALSDDLGHAWAADEPEVLGGGNTAPDPARLMLSSLGACTAIALRMVAARRGWPLTGICFKARGYRPIRLMSGYLELGRWRTGWYNTARSGGEFVRSTAGFRKWVTADGSSGFAAERGRYHLYGGCPKFCV